VPPHIATALLVMVALLLFAFRVRGQLASVKDPSVPDARFSARNLAEIVTEMITNLARGAIGHDVDAYVPLFGSLFLFILGANLIGLLPGSRRRPTTSTSRSRSAPSPSRLQLLWRARARGRLPEAVRRSAARPRAADDRGRGLQPPLPARILGDPLYGNMFADHLLLGSSRT